MIEVKLAMHNGNPSVYIVKTQHDDIVSKDIIFLDVNTELKKLIRDLKKIENKLREKK